MKYGNRHPDFVPHGCFRCAGEDNWIVVAVSGDAMWPKLASCSAAPTGPPTPALATAAGRRRIESEIEAAITQWTSARTPDEAMAALQAAGVAAGVARMPIELLRDAHLKARGFIQEIDRAYIGPHPQPSMPFREGDKPLAIRSAPPTLGEHNREILAGLLGLSDAEIDQLDARRHHRNRDADGGRTGEREEAGGRLMAAAQPRKARSDRARAARSR